MAISRFQDFTNEFNAGSGIVIDVSGSDYVVVQFVTPSGALTFNSTLDGGAVQGVSDGSAATATNFVAVQGINLTTGTGASTIAASAIFRFPVIGKYLQITGSAVTAVKVLVQFFRIS